MLRHYCRLGHRELCLICVDLVEVALERFGAAAPLGAQVALTLYVDDLTVEARGDRSAVGARLAEATDWAVAYFSKS